MTENKKRLIFGSLPENYDPVLDIVAGPWSFIGKEKNYLEAESNTYTTTFETPEEMEEAAKQTTSWAVALVQEIMQEENRKQGLSYGEEFWRIVLMPWALTLMQVLYERYMFLEKITKKFKIENIEYEVHEYSEPVQFRDTKHFMINGILNVDYNSHIYKILLKKKAPSDWKEVNRPAKQERDEIAPVKDSLKEKIKKNLFSRGRCFGVYGIDDKFNPIWSAYLRILPPVKNIKNEYLISSNIPDKIRSEMCLDYFIKETFPVNLKNIKLLESEKQYFKKGKIRLIGPYPISFDDAYKVKLGLAAEAGEKIITTQHGGNYGFSRSFSFPALVEYPQTAFFTWGWSSHGFYSGNFIPLPSPHLSKYLGKHKPTIQKKIILVGTNNIVINFRSESFPQPPERVLYRKKRRIFIESLGHELRNHLYYRPDFHQGAGLDDLPYFQKNFPDLKIIRKNFHHELMNCTLAVLDHVGTTITITMSANVPTLCFWTDKHFAVSPEKIYLFEKLRKVGILHETPEDAAKYLQVIQGDISRWWNSESVQNARREWVYEFARTSRFWWWDWMKALWKISREKNSL